MQKCACRSGFVCIRSLSSRSLNGREFPLRYLKIGSRYCTYYDYGMHLLRMLKRAISFDELTHSGKYVSFSKIDGVTVFEPQKHLK